MTPAEQDAVDLTRTLLRIAAVWFVAGMALTVATGGLLMVPWVGGTAGIVLAAFIGYSTFGPET